MFYQEMVIHAMTLESTECLTSAEVNLFLLFKKYLKNLLILSVLSVSKPDKEMNTERNGIN